MTAGKRAFVAISRGLGSCGRAQRFDYFAIIRNTLLAAFLASLANLAHHCFKLYAVVGRLTLVYGAALSVVGVVLLQSAAALVVRQHPYRFTIAGKRTSTQELLKAWTKAPEGARHELVPWESSSGNCALGSEGQPGGHVRARVLRTRLRAIPTGAYDLFYLCNYSVRMDVQMVLRTIFFLVRGARVTLGACAEAAAVHTTEG